MIAFQARKVYRSDPSDAQAAFTFSHAATRSPLSEDVKEAIVVLERLVIRGAARWSWASRTSRDCVYTLALAHARLKVGFSL